MAIAGLPIVGPYNQARFRQFNPADTAGWYLIEDAVGKKTIAMYPTMGREHINFSGQNQLIFEAEPRVIFKSINYWYAVVLNKIYRIDNYFNKIEITQNLFPTIAGAVYFTYLVTASTGSMINPLAPTFAIFTDGLFIYVYNEATDSFQVVTDANAPPNPLFIATFGNRIVVSTSGSSQFGLSEINLEGSSFNPATCFTIASAAIFAQADGVIRQMFVLDNTLYIMTDFTTNVWSDTPSYLTSVGGIQSFFPWTNNKSYNWNYGIADPTTLSVGFDRAVWMAKNREGLIQPMMSGGQKPIRLTEKSDGVDVLIQRLINVMEVAPPANGLGATGFLFDYENTIFYRLNIGNYVDTQLVDYLSDATSIEYNFDTGTWHRCIEVNGQRNRIQRHVYFGNRHLVTVQGDSTVYEMSGSFYTNDISNPAESDPQASDAYIREPMRYERVTPLIFESDYMEFVTHYVEIDFVWGITPFVRTNGAYANTVFLIAEQPDDNGNPIFLVSDTDPNQYLIAEQGNFPQLDSPTYYNYYKPIIELFFSDDGGISFQTLDVREFSQIGQYEWRMRWYECGTSRNRCYKLACVSPVPIVVLGGVQQKSRVQEYV